MNRRFLEDCVDHLASGALRPMVDRTFALDDALQAQEYMRHDTHLGKIVLIP